MRFKNEKIFILNDIVFSSSTNAVLYSLPGDDDYSKVVHEDSLIKECSARRWLAPCNLYTSFIPLRVDWNTPLLRQFAYNRRSLPIDQIGSKYQLRRSVLDQWLEFEKLLDFIQNTLLNVSGLLVPLGMVSFKGPSEWGYTRVHKKESIAHSCAMNAKESFVHMMAFTTFIMAVNVGVDADCP
jgi:hypothetical protein